MKALANNIRNYFMYVANCTSVVIIISQRLIVDDKIKTKE
jgi:hypothetical protein